MDYVEFVMQNEKNDIFRYMNMEGDYEYLNFPRTMEMTVEDVRQWLEK